MATAQTHRRISCREQTGKDLVAISQIAIIWIGERGAKPVLAHRPYRHNLLWLGHGQGPEQHNIDQTENRRVRPNPKREREHGHRGKAGMLQQLAEGEFQIVHGSLSVVSCPWSGCLLVTHNAAPPSDRLSKRVAPAASKQ